jgi:hypothetical protein
MTLDTHGVQTLRTRMQCAANALKQGRSHTCKEVANIGESLEDLGLTGTFVVKGRKVQIDIPHQPDVHISVEAAKKMNPRDLANYLNKGPRVYKNKSH